MRTGDMRELAELWDECQVLNQVCVDGEIITKATVPHTQRIVAFASKWSSYSRIRAIGLRFLLVQTDGGITEV